MTAFALLGDSATWFVWRIQPLNSTTAEEQAFFRPQGDLWRATELTRGPWSPQFQHAGPPSALLAREIERSLPAETPMAFARVTIEVLKPIPVGLLRVVPLTLRAGRKVQWLGAELSDESGVLLARASAVCIRTSTIPVPESAVPAFDRIAGPTEGMSFTFPFFQGDIGYHTAMDLRLARGVFGSGEVAMWMRMRYPLVPGEVPSPVQRVMCAADSGNGVSLALDVRRYTFMNPDLTVYLHRMPVGEWVCLDARTIPQSNGIGLAETRLLDEQGAIGRSQQSLIIEAR